MGYYFDNAMYLTECVFKHLMSQTCIFFLLLGMFTDQHLEGLKVLSLTRFNGLIAPAFLNSVSSQRSSSGNFATARNRSACIF